MQFKKLKKPIRYGLSGLLMIGVILTLGFLSFASAIAWCGLIGVGIMAFTLAGVIEGEVYAQGINEAWKKFFNRNHLRDAICVRTLDELLASKNITTNKFLQDYQALKEAIHHAEEQAKENARTKALVEVELDRKLLAGEITAPAKNNALEEAKNCNIAAAKKLKALKNDLKLMQKYFREFISGNVSDENINKLSIDKPAILAEIQRKIWLSRGILLMSIIAGIGMGLVFLNVAPAGIVSLASLFGVTLIAAALPQALLIVLFVFAVITAAGYMSLIYKALTSVLEKNLSLWLQNLRDYFHRRPAESNLQFGVRIGVSVFVGLIIAAIGIFATVTTAGTWWYAAQAGVTLIVPAITAITWAVNIIVGITAFATLIFTLAYSLETMQKLSNLSSKFFTKKWQEFTDKIKSAWQNYNVPQVIIVLITEIFKVLAFIGHIIFTGLVGEGSNLLPEKLKGLTTLINATSDLTVDATSHMDIEDDCSGLEETHEGEHHHHDDDNELHDVNDKHPHHDPLPLSNHSHFHTHHGHSHEHFDIPEWVCKFLLVPLCVISTLWDFCMTPNTHLKRDQSVGTFFETWGNMLKKSWIKCFFGIEALDLTVNKNVNETPAPTLDANYRQTLSILKISRTLDNPEKSSELKSAERDRLTTLKNEFEQGQVSSLTGLFSELDTKSERGTKLYKKLLKINHIPQLTP